MTEKEKQTLKELGERIRLIRMKRCMSQMDLAFDSGLSKSYLCDLEAGRRNPSMLTLDKIALALEVSLSDLLYGIGIK